MRFIYVGLLLLFSSASFAMNTLDQVMVKMTLVANNGSINVPLELAKKAETLKYHLDFAFHSGNDIPQFLFHQDQSTDEDIVYQSAEQVVLHDLFEGIANPDHIRLSNDFDRLKKLFIIADYLRVPSYTRGLILCRLLNSLNSDEFSRLNPQVAGMVLERLNDAIKDGFLDLRGAGFTNLEGLYAFFNAENYENPSDALDGSEVTAIDLSNNRLQEIDMRQLLTYFPNLRQLDLSHNQITTIDTQLLPYGFRLDLSYNRLDAAQFRAFGHRQCYINCAHNNLDEEAARSIERKVHRGDRVYWARKGIASILPLFSPTSLPMQLTGLVLKLYLNSLLDKSRDNSLNRISYLGSLKNKVMESIPTQKKIGNRDIPVREYLETSLDVGLSAGIYTGALLAPRTFLTSPKTFYRCAGIGLHRQLGGRAHVFNHYIFNPAFKRFIRRPLFNRVINPIVTRVDTGYRRYAAPHVTRMNEYITRDSNSVQL